jgi:hypothetical protein
MFTLSLFKRYSFLVVSEIFYYKMIRAYDSGFLYLFYTILIRGIIMKSLTRVTLSAVMTLILLFTAHASNKGLSTHKLLASQIYSAAFNDISPGYDDLYVIKTQDKGREIVIYCNTTYCYKNRNSIMTS